MITANTTTHAKGLQCQRQELSETGLKCLPRGTVYKMTNLWVQKLAEINKENKLNNEAGNI